MKQAIQTEKAPAAIGPYSQGLKRDGLLFISGQLPLDPQTGKILEGDIHARTRQVLENMEEILKEAGGRLSNVVKTTIFLTDLDDFAEINAVYATFFPDCPPARSTVQVAALPLGSNMEIEAIAVLP